MLAGQTALLTLFPDHRSTCGRLSSSFLIIDSLLLHPTGTLCATLKCRCRSPALQSGARKTSPPATSTSLYVTCRLPPHSLQPDRQIEATATTTPQWSGHPQAPGLRTRPPVPSSTSQD